MRSLIDKILRQKLIQWKDGNVTLWGINGLFSALFVQIYLYKILEKEAGKNTAMKLFYWQGRFQADQGVKILEKRFGYAKKISDKVERLKMAISNSHITGLGDFEWIRIDFESQVFVVRGRSSFSNEGKILFDNPNYFYVDHHMRGQFSKIVESVLGMKTLCIQRRLSGKNNSVYEFIIKPLGKWDMTDPIVKEQFVDPDNPSFCELGGKGREPYML